MDEFFRYSRIPYADIVSAAEDPTDNTDHNVRAENEKEIKQNDQQDHIHQLIIAFRRHFIKKACQKRLADQPVKYFEDIGERQSVP